MKKVAFVIAGLFFSLAGHAAEGKWIEGFGQGNLEYFIDKQGYRLYIGCPTDAGSADASSGVSLIKNSDDSPGESLTVPVAGFTYQGPFEADSRVGDNNFISFLENIRKGNAVVKFKGKSITFPKSNAGKTIPMYGTKGFSCNMS